MFLPDSFVYRLVTNWLFTVFTVTSRKFRLSREVSELKVMLALHWFRYVIKVSSSLLPWSQIINMSSM